MAVLTLTVTNDLGQERRLLIHGDAIAFVDCTGDELIVRMKTGDLFRCEGLVGWNGYGDGHEEIHIRQEPVGNRVSENSPEKGASL